MRALVGFVALTLFGLGVVHSPEAQAKRKPIKLTVPVDVGVGPAFHMVTGPIGDDQLFHYGLKLEVRAIIDNATIRKHKNKIPKKYRKTALKIRELRVSPSIFIPDTLFISPKVDNVGMYGVVFRPLSLGLPLLHKPVRLHLGLGPLLTYAYIDDDRPEARGDTHFLRIGADLRADLEIPFSKSFLISIGWASQFYIPQELGAGVFDVGDLDNSIWHIGQAYVMLHFRFPYTTSF